MKPVTTHIHAAIFAALLLSFLAAAGITGCLNSVSSELLEKGSSGDFSTGGLPGDPSTGGPPGTGGMGIPVAFFMNESYGLDVYIGDGTAVPAGEDRTAARSVVGPDDARIKGIDLGTRNYAQVVVIENSTKRLVAIDDCRDEGSGVGTLQIPQLDPATEYRFLVLMGHWERDEASGEYLDIEDYPPTLLAAGYRIGT
ncbi:MAG: hypothetical protein LBP20_02290, partial [Treponema sp.]|nr:hypothetical protein [Treponema sp.]